MITKPNKEVRAVEAGDAYVFSLGELYRIFRRKLWIILLVIIVVSGATMGYAQTKTPRYEASVKILVGQSNGVTDGPEAVPGLQQVTQTMAEAIKSSSVAEAVIQRQNLSMSSEDLLRNLDAKQVGSSQFIEVKYTDPAPEMAQQVVNAVGEVFSEQISEANSSDGRRNAVTATVWQQAQTPLDIETPDKSNWLLLSLMLGTVLGLGLALLLEYRNDSWRSPEEAERTVGVPFLAAIPKFEVSKGRKTKKRGSDG